MKLKKANLTVWCLLLTLCVGAQINAPLPSPQGTVSSKVGLTDVKIEYFRPKKKGRKIFGSGDDFLISYGKIWRTGANSGTKLTLSTDANVGGNDVKAGTYLVFTQPNASNWNFILYSDVTIGGNVAGYKKENEVLNISVAAEKLSKPVETLTFNISDINEKNTQANIHFSWDNVSFKVPIKVNFDEMIMKEIAEKTKVNPANYTTAANYYLETNRDLEQALKWMDMYLAIGDNANQFWHLYTKARILKGLGRKKETIAVAKDSIAKASKNESGDFGYIKRNEDLLKDLK